MTDLLKGQCLCGAVQVSAKLKGAPGIQACHCGQCRRWTGGSPYLCVWVEGLSFEGEDNIARYHASDWGERGFCRTCGTTLFWAMQGKIPDSIAVGLLDDQSGLTVTEEIFTDRRAGWLPVWKGASQSTEAEQIEKFDAYMAKQGG